MLLLAAALIWLIPADPAYIRAKFTIEHVEFLNIPDNRGQQWAHRILVGLLGLLALGLWLARPRSVGNPPAPLKRALDAFVRYGGVAVAVLYVLAVVSEGRPIYGDETSFHGRYVLFADLSLRTQLLLAVFGAAGAYVWWRISAQQRVLRLLQTAALVACGVYILGLILLGLFRDPSFMGFTPPLIAGVEWHYSGSVASADRIAIGERLGDVPIHSSLLGSVLLGIWESANAILDFGGHIRLLSVLQTAMIAITALAYGAWYGWRPAPWLIGLLLALPWIHPLQAAVLYPNQSAWRFLALCIGIALLALAHARKLRSIAPLLGFVGGFALLWNAETGLALNLAYIVFLVLQNTASASSGWKSALAYAGGFAAALIAFCFIVRTGLGYWPDAVAIAKSFPLIGNFSRGYGGLRFKGVDPLALLVFAHALFVLTRGILDWASRVALSPRECGRIALAALLVVWAAYYFRAPHPWNLWSALLIYGYLVGDVLPSRRRAGADANPGVPVRPMILGMVLIPAIVASNIISLKSAVLTARQPRCAVENVVSGICLAGPIANRMRDKAAALRAHAARHPVLYFTADSYLMLLMSGVSQPLAQRDAFSETVLTSEFSDLVSSVLAVHPACILYDDPTSDLSGYDAHRKFYARLRSALAHEYERRGGAHGWEVHCKKTIG